MTPLERLVERLVDARRLLEIHEEATGAAAGRRHNVDVLNRSAMLLTVAAWEGFCEDLVSVSSARISRRLQNSRSLPSPIIRPLMFWFHDEYQISKPSDTAKDAMWQLSGDGWRLQYRKYSQRKVDDLNTPNFQRLKKLVSQTLGISDFGSNWRVGRYTPEYYVGRLDGALRIRHQIAHGARGDVTVGKTTATRTIALVERLASWTADAVAQNEASLDLAIEDLVN